MGDCYLVKYEYNGHISSSMIIKNGEGQFMDAPVVYCISKNKEKNRFLWDQKKLSKLPLYLQQKINNMGNLPRVKNIFIIDKKFEQVDMSEWNNFPIITKEPRKNGPFCLNILEQIILDLSGCECKDYISAVDISRNEINSFIEQTKVNEIQMIQEDEKNERILKITNRIKSVWSTTAGVYVSATNSHNMNNCYVNGSVLQLFTKSYDNDHLIPMSVIALLFSRCKNNMNNDEIRKICNFVHFLETVYHRNFKTAITDNVMYDVAKRMLYEDIEVTVEEILKLHCELFQQKIHEMNTQEERNSYINSMKNYCKILPCLVRYFLSVINTWKTLLKEDGVIIYDRLYLSMIIHFESFIGGCIGIHSHDSNMRNIEMIGGQLLRLTL